MEYVVIHRDMKLAPGAGSDHRAAVFAFLCALQVAHVKRYAPLREYVHSFEPVRDVRLLMICHLLGLAKFMISFT